MSVRLRRNRSMAIWISDDGTESEIRLADSGLVLEKHDINAWVGKAVGIFLLSADLVMIADLSAVLKGATRNAKAIRLLRGSAFEPLADIYGSVLVARHNEVAISSLIRDDP
jgi:hypothetical protein